MTYFTRNRWFHLRRDAFATRSQSWIAYESEDTTPFCYGSSQDDLMRQIGSTIDLHERIAARLARKGL